MYKTQFPKLQDQSMYNSKIDICKYYKLQDANQFKNDPLTQSQFYQIHEQQFKSTEYVQLVKHFITNKNQVGITRIINIYQCLKQKFQCYQSSDQQKTYQKIFINKELTEIVVFIQFKKTCKSELKLDLSIFRRLIKQIIISNQIFKFAKPVCSRCGKIVSGFCEEVDCQQLKIFCLDCEGINKHLLHMNSRIQYKEIKQIVGRMNQFILEVVKPSALLSHWKQILQSLNQIYLCKKTIKMFMHDQGIYFFQKLYSLPLLHNTNTQKLIQAIYRSKMLDTTSLKLEFISFMQQRSQQYQLFYKFSEKFHANILKMRLTYFTLSNDQSGALSRIQKFDTLNQLLESDLHPDVIMGTKTNKVIDKRYLQGLYASRSQTGIVVKTTLRGNRCLVFTLDRSLVMGENITDIIWDDVDDNKIEYCQKLFVYDKTNALQFEVPNLQLKMI